MNDDSIIFAVKEKVNSALALMNRADSDKKFQFWYGQYMAFNEILSLLNNNLNRES